MELLAIMAQPSPHLYSNFKQLSNKKTAQTLQHHGLKEKYELYRKAIKIEYTQIISQKEVYLGAYHRCLSGVSNSAAIEMGPNMLWGTDTIHKHTNKDFQAVTQNKHNSIQVNKRVEFFSHNFT